MANLRLSLAVTWLAQPVRGFDNNITTALLSTYF